MNPSYSAGRYLMKASGVSYMWLSASNTGKSRTRDGIVTPFSIDQSLPYPGAGPPGPGHQVNRSTGTSATLPGALRELPTGRARREGPAQGPGEGDQVLCSRGRTRRARSTLQVT